MKLQRRMLALLGAGLTIVSNPGIAAADAAAIQPERVLFEDAVQLMNEGHFEQACAKFQQSLDIAKTAATLYALAECNMKWDHPAEALIAYDEYIVAYDALSSAQKAKHSKRIGLARTEREIVRARVASITVVAPGIKSFDVFIDDRRRGSGDSTIRVFPLNPREHHVQVLIPERAPHDVRVILHEGENLSIEPLSSSGVKPPIKPTNPGSETPPKTGQVVHSGGDVVVESRVEHDEPVQKTSGARIAGFIAFGVGTAGFATAGVFTGLMWPNRETSMRDCDSSASSGVAYCKTKEATAAGNEAIRYANLSTIGVGVGIVGVAAGAVLLAVSRNSTMPSKTAVPWITGHVHVGASSAGVSVSGVW